MLPKALYPLLVSMTFVRRAKSGWDKLIQTLDKGSFDNYKLLKYLKDIGYTGPVGLQGYRIEGDAKENLASSMKAWREINKKLATGVSE